MIINPFTNIPTENYIPKYAKIIFVADYFAKDLIGGAELTTQAFLDRTPVSCFCIHSNSLTPEVFDKVHKGVHWVFFNFANLPTETILKLSEEARYGLKYSIVEYDFKICKYRSFYRHKLETGSDCDCHKTKHGTMICNFYKSAKNILWMSERQKEIFISKTKINETNNLEALWNGKHHIQSSTFDIKTLDVLKNIKNKTKKNDKFAILGSGSWIKGIEQTENYCIDKKINYEKLPNLPYEQFLETLAKYKGFIFMPLDYDTCPRSVIEAKLLGCELILNENVLHKDEIWFNNKDSEEVDFYLRDRVDNFWKIIYPISS